MKTLQKTFAALLIAWVICVLSIVYVKVFYLKPQPVVIIVPSEPGAKGEKGNAGKPGKPGKDGKDGLKGDSGAGFWGKNKDVK